MPMQLGEIRSRDLSGFVTLLSLVDISILPEQSTRLSMPASLLVTQWPNELVGFQSEGF